MRNFLFGVKFNFIDIVGMFISINLFELLMKDSRYGFFIAITVGFLIILLTSFISVVGQKWENFKQMWKDTYGDGN